MNVSNGSGANGTGINGGNSGLGNATESGWQVIGGDPETRPKNTSVMFIIRASISGTSLVYGISPVVGDIDMANTYKVINAVTGSNTNDLVTKGYVDAQIATTASIPTRITNSTNSASSL